MLSAKRVAELIGAEHDDTVAYGYTFDRVSVAITYEDGEFVRYVAEYGEEFVRTASSGEAFDPGLFRGCVKRFYADRTCPKLVELFATFGNPLPLV